MKKKVTALVLAGILMMGVCGCMGRSASEIMADKKETVLAGMREHLLQRYGEFDYVPGPVLLRNVIDLTSTEECYMHIPQGENQDEFKVERLGTAEEGYTYQDNYYWYVIRDEYEAQMKEELAELFPECKVFLGISWSTPMISNELDRDTTLEQAKKFGMPKHTFDVYVNPTLFSPNDLKAMENVFKAKWGDSRPKPVINIVLPASQDIYSNIDRYNSYDLKHNNGYIAYISN